MAGKKEMIFIQSSLRSAKQLYEEGGHVTMEYNDQSFRLVYYNKRKILSGASTNNPSSGSSASSNDFSNGSSSDSNKLKLYDSIP